jgi:hypothetical protein
MELKTLCINNIAELIKKLPPLLQEEVIKVSIKSIKEDAEKKAYEKYMKEIKLSAVIVTEDITKLIIRSHQTGINWKRPEYTKDIDDELYHTLVHVSESFVNNNVNVSRFAMDYEYYYQHNSDSESDSEY